MIFPLKWIDWNKGRYLDDIRKRVEEANRRQFISFENLEPDEKSFEERVKTLMEDIINVPSILDPLLLSQTTPSTSLSLSSGDLVQIQARVGTNREYFLRCLSQAANVTIIGITNQNLVTYLQEALDRKRSQENPEAFWNSLRVIFLSRSMLADVEDELIATFPDRNEASLNRVQIAVRSKRSLSNFLLRESRPQQWSLYECNFMLPLIGAIFEMPDGQKIVQIATPRPGYSTSDHLFFEFSQEASIVAYYQSAFEEIVQRCTRLDEIVIVGTPQSREGSGFVFRHTRFQRTVLRSQSNINDWLPLVFIVLWREEAGIVWPLMQIRTSENATRELDRLSCISGYINKRDCQELDTGEFLLPTMAYLNAACRELQEELGIKDYMWPTPELVREVRFYHRDHENLYFFVCRLKVDIPLHRFHASSQLHEWSFAELLKVREYQVLSNALVFLSRDKASRSQLERTAHIIADNLVLHHQSSLAQNFLPVLYTGEDQCEKVRARLRVLMKEKQVRYDLYGESKLCTRSWRPDISGLF